MSESIEFMDLVTVAMFLVTVAVFASGIVSY